MGSILLTWEGHNKSMRTPETISFWSAQRDYQEVDQEKHDYVSTDLGFVGPEPELCRHLV